LQNEIQNEVKILTALNSHDNIVSLKEVLADSLIFEHLNRTLLEEMATKVAPLEAKKMTY
jgi:serine/threonine protein kinase